MYLSGFTYYHGSEQRHTRANFLLLIQPKDQKPSAENTYAIVRKVALRQFGHFMMGSANIAGKWRTVSGAYGNDGLPMDVDALPSDAVKLPGELYEAWNKGQGWNGSGNEAFAMAEWARKTLAIKLSR